MRTPVPRRRVASARHALRLLVENSTRATRAWCPRCVNDARCAHGACTAHARRAHELCLALGRVDFQFQQAWAAGLCSFLLATSPRVLACPLESWSEADDFFFGWLDEVFQVEELRLLEGIAMIRAKLDKENFDQSKLDSAVEEAAEALDAKREETRQILNSCSEDVRLVGEFEEKVRHSLAQLQAMEIRRCLELKKESLEPSKTSHWANDSALQPHILGLQSFCARLHDMDGAVEILQKILSTPSVERSEFHSKTLDLLHEMVDNYIACMKENCSMLDWAPVDCPMKEVTLQKAREISAARTKIRSLTEMQRQLAALTVGSTRFSLQ